MYVQFEWAKIQIYFDLKEVFSKNLHAILV